MIDHVNDVIAEIIWYGSEWCDWNAVCEGV